MDSLLIDNLIAQYKDLAHRVAHHASGLYTDINEKLMKMALVEEELKELRSLAEKVKKVSGE